MGTGGRARGRYGAKDRKHRKGTLTGGKERELGQGTRTGNIDRGQIQVVKQNSKITKQN